MVAISCMVLTSLQGLTLILALALILT